MRQSVCRQSGGGARWMCVGCTLDSHLCRLADEVVLHPAGHQVHHITCSMRVSQTGNQSSSHRLSTSSHIIHLFKDFNCRAAQTRQKKQLSFLDETNLFQFKNSELFHGTFFLCIFKKQPEQCSIFTLKCH